MPASVALGYETVITADSASVDGSNHANCYLEGMRNEIARISGVPRGYLVSDRERPNWSLKEMHISSNVKPFDDEDEPVKLKQQEEVKLILE